VKDELCKFSVIDSTLNEIFSICDIITIHAGLTEETRNLINKEHFSIMRDGVILINTARGPIINVEDLLRFLPDKKPYLLFDVFDEEPIPHNYPLINYDRAVLTPHIAGPSDDALFKLGEASLKGIESFLKGRPLKGLLTKEKALRAT